MPSKKKTGVAYIVCGVVILALTLVFNLPGWKLFAGIGVGVVLTVVGFLLTKKD